MFAARGSLSGPGAFGKLRTGRNPAKRPNSETHAQMRGDLGAVGKSNVRQTHGAEQDGVGPARGFEGLVGDVDARVPIELRAAFELLVLEAKAADAALQRLEHMQARGHDLVADAVALEGRDLKRAVLQSLVSFPALIGQRGSIR